MRQFVVHGHDAPTDADFALEDLASGAGRLDLLARSLLAGLLLSHEIREDVRVHLVLADELTLTFDGASLRSLHPDERSAAALIRSTLEHRDEAVGRMAVDTSPGITIERATFEQTLRDLDADAPLVPLLPDGRPVADIDPPENPVFFLSDNQPFTEAERALLADLGEEPLSLGPRALHTDQAITVAHNWLDTDGFTQY
jgi:tRNA (pseudouridine54-N1)-methyltransferase